ncbi:hypothetical protein FB451DRAFT_1555112 [Mycena latifolia]|nr:hypothetical protein FB451DRAFT_1555112 [Mycena latifolia]
MHFTKAQTLILGILVDRASSRTSNVGWISPLAQDIYGPGATILAEWASPETIDSPCFKLCMATPSDSRLRSVGVTESAGVYQAPITVDDVPSSGQFYLQMEDSSGTKMRSPVFTLSPVGASSSSGSESIAGIEPQAQAPLGPANSPVTPIVPPASPLALNQASAAATLDPNVLSAKSSPPPVALAVPLSAMAAIILVAGGLFLKHRRKLNAQRVKNADKPSRASTVSSYKTYASRGSEVDHALHVLPRHRGYQSPPLPLFMPQEYGMTKGQNTSPSKRDVFARPAYARWDPPAYGYVSYHRDSPADTHSSSPSMHSPYRDEWLRLPPISTTGSFMSASDPATHAVLADYILPSPTLPASTSTPRCLLPAPQKLHLRDDGSRSSDNPLGSPSSDRQHSERDLYARVESKLHMYRRS